MRQPVFSIITVVYNGEALLPGTLSSVQKQTYQQLEYIIVDGGSKDSTVDIIRQFAETAMPGKVKWITEPDKGLYDAMNKGLKMATGDFVWFMNCGDHLFDLTTIAKVAEQADENTDVLYGETMLVDNNRIPAGTMSELSTRQVPDVLNWHDYLYGMLVVHQSFVARRSIAPVYIPDNLCADYDWCIKILKQSRQNVRIDQPLTSYLMGGLSKQKHRQALWDRFDVMREHFGLIRTVLAHIYIVCRAIFHRFMRLNKTRY
jgi:glycosyltransferase involved in cell wall biosynthesis